MPCGASRRSLRTSEAVAYGLRGTLLALARRVLHVDAFPPFQVGDRLLAINGKLVTDGHEQFSKRIQQSPPEVRLVVSGFTSVSAGLPVPRSCRHSQRAAARSMASSHAWGALQVARGSQPRLSWQTRLGPHDVILFTSAHPCLQAHTLHKDAEGVLGIRLCPGAPVGSPPVLSDVQRGSSAWQAGLRAGDVLVSVDNNVVFDADTAMQSIARSRRALPVVILRPCPGDGDSGSGSAACGTAPATRSVPQVQVAASRQR